jgi:hypothetical protein
MKKLLLSFISVLLGISIMAQNATNLKLNLEKNKVYRLKSSSEQTLSQTMNGVQQTTNIKSSSTVSIKMIDAAAEFLIAEVRFDTMITNTNAMGKMVIINSASEGDIKSAEMADVMSCIMNRLSKNALYVKMDYVGKVIDIVNSKMLSDVIMKDTGSITGETASVSKMQIKNTINDKALKSMVEAYTNNLPGRQVTTGDKWDITVTMNAGGMSLDIITTYNLDALNGSVANITAESNIKASENADPIEYSGAKITFGDLKGLGKSNMVINTLTGLLIGNTTKTHIAGNLNVSVQGMNMQIPMEIDGESKVIALP